jgi:hypothetical protein
MGPSRWTRSLSRFRGTPESPGGDCHTASHNTARGADLQASGDRGDAGQGALPAQPGGVHAHPPLGDPECHGWRDEPKWLEQANGRSDVRRVDLDVGGSGHLAQSVPLIQADKVHALGFTGRGVTVAVLDSGLATTHPDLSDALLSEQCFCTNADGTGCCPDGSTQQSGPGSAEDDQGHGTNVTGIITSAGRIAPVGVAPDAGIVAVKVIDSQGRFASSAQVSPGSTGS